MAIDKNAIMEYIRGILIALGDDPEREGLKETPERVANMYEEIFEGMIILTVKSQICSARLLNFRTQKMTIW